MRQKVSSEQHNGKDAQRAAKGPLASKAAPTKVIGFSEIGFGVLVAVLTAWAV
ncbi:MAG: hypothetical protein J7551_08750 [Chloroflexi bacterium]|jgi:hypothetical protein|nr:hypothetical protein [Chloroflexota bacterium]